METIASVLQVFGVLSPFAVAYFVWRLNGKNEKRKAEIDYLKQQLEHFYGPVEFFASANERLFRLSKNVLQESSKLARKQGSSKVAIEEHKKHIQLSNAYIREVVQNNGKLVKIFEEQWGWIDIADIEEFNEMYVHFVRERTERGGLAPNLEVSEGLGSISFMPPKFIELVKQRFEEKRRRLSATIEI